MNFDNTKYDLILEEKIEELKSEGFLFKHKKSGARVLILSNDDENKVFSIGFRTPPPDSTGVPHILEHSVLCGSDKYPVKDPFVELVKGSLNTFLNAMTYSDKTVYPVASCNDADFKNLMDVYMDAVLHPNIYNRKEIFMQEGWHYELESADAPLVYNGVVYNEMKGAFSSPDSALARYCLNSLYPDTSYATESGGDPKYIPDLSYEEFLNFHKKLYHPSNSYIYIYGDCDMEERLDYLDREYLCHYDKITVDSEIAYQEPFDAMRRVCAKYSVTEQEGTENKTYLAYNISAGDALNKELSLAMQIVDYALFSAPGAPVKQALIDAGIGDDVSCSYDSEIKQPMFTIMAKNTNPDREEEFVSIIKDTLSEVVSKGINRDALRAGINSMEFAYREADFGRFPKGLMYGLNLLGSWLYDENEPFMHIAQNDTYKFLKENIDTGYFEKIVEKYLLNNTHCSLVVMEPVVGLTAMEEEETANKLAEYKASLTEAEINEIIENTNALKKYQSEPSTEEELEKIPMLTRQDMKKDIEPVNNIIEDADGVKVYHHDIYTNGIGYLKVLFNIENVADEDIPYVGLLACVIGYINTKKHSFDELSNIIDIHTGGIAPFFDVYEDFNDNSRVNAYLGISAKALTAEYDKVFSLIREMIFESDYGDYKRMKEILAETRSRLQSKFLSAGHVTAVGMASAQFSVPSKYTSCTSGYEFYNFISNILENYESCKENVAIKLNDITDKIFGKDKMVVSFTADCRTYDAIKPLLKDFIGGLKKSAGTVIKRNFVFEKKKIAYKTASQVNYVARCGNFANNGQKYSPALKILKTILGYDFLWINIRVKGGAYGCMNGYAVNGKSYFVSYRDPNVAQTNEIYEQIPEYLENFDATEREMTKYIIGTFSELDTPLTPAAKGDRSFDLAMRNVSEEFLKNDRLGIIQVKKEDIQALAPVIQAVLKDDYLCVIGNDTMIEKDAHLFDEITTLF